MAACPVIGPSKDPCKGPVIGPSKCKCPQPGR
ncbi:PA0050 family protein [Pseudomonas chlororaphis]